MENTGYIDSLRDPEIISYASPTCKRYQRTLVLLYLLLFLDIVFVFVIPPVGIVVMSLLIVFIVRQTKKLNGYLSAVQEEIQLTGKMPEWWNEGCKEYRKLSKLPPEKRLKKLPGGAVTNQAVASAGKPSGEVTATQKAVVNTAAAYGLGKAATSAVNNTTPVKRASRNSNTGNAMAAREKARAAQDLRGNRQKERITVKGKSYYITTMPNGNQVLTDVGNKHIGTYDKIRNVTTDGNARKIGNGNLLKTLICGNVYV